MPWVGAETQPPYYKEGTVDKGSEVTGYVRKGLLETLGIVWSCTGNQLEIHMLTQKQVTNRSRRCC